jgi:hypothetical protein
MSEILSHDLITADRRNGKGVYRFSFLFCEKKTVSKSLVKISTIFIHSCRDETRLAAFSVPFPQTKFPNVFVPARRRRHNNQMKEEAA